MSGRGWDTDRANVAASAGSDADGNPGPIGQPAASHPSWTPPPLPDVGLAQSRPWHAAQYAFLCPQWVSEETLAYCLDQSVATGHMPEDVLIAHGVLDRETYEQALLSRLAKTQTTDALASGQLRKSADPRLRFAVSGLRRTRPELSAAGGLWVWQLVALAAAPGLIIGALAIAPDLAIAAALGLLTAMFFFIVLIRLLAAVLVLTSRSESGDITRLRLSDDELPTYAVLVPLFQEAEVAADCVAALAALDYPPDKLDVVFCVEADDPDTFNALVSAGLPQHFRIARVPKAKPRTKPKALNYALADLASDYVVIFDAEDLPEPDQLRKAAARFLSEGPILGCVQARLNVYNWRDGWLARQFTLEYSALFDGLLRALEKTGVPIPLGGTSNHFPRRLLREIGGWDAHNVTEDADLGLRLARLGYRVSVLNATTWEEAPASFGVWLRQRTRWIKGWLQTYAVHMRRPFRLLWDFGPWRFVCFQLLVGGLLASAFLHPLVYVLVLHELTQDAPFARAKSGAEAVLWWLAFLNLAVGALSSIVLSAVAVAKRGRLALWVILPTMPAYWFLISIAAYRALWQVWRAPFRWEKTPHRARRKTERRLPQRP